MRRIVLSLSVCSALAFSSFAAEAAPKKVKLSLKEKRIVKKEDKQVQEDLVTLNKACGTKIKVSMDWASFKKGDAINGSSSSPCESMLGNLQRICRDDDGKEALKDGVKEIVCAWGKRDATKHELAKGILTDTSWVKTGGGEYFVAQPSIEKWLAEKL